MKQGGRTWLIYNASLFVAAVGALLYFFVLRHILPPFPCAFACLTHLYCPGCGFTRALGALLRLDLPLALAANPMAIWLCLTLFYYEVAFLLAWRRGRRVSTLPAVVFAYALLGYAVLRNLLLVTGGIDPLGDLIQYWSK